MKYSGTFRVFLLGWVLALIMLPLQACAQGKIMERPDGRITAEVDARILECLSPQDKSKWCWASCIQAVLRYYGCNSGQRTIAVRVLGRSEDAAVGSHQMVEKLNGWQINGYEISASEDSPIDMRLIVQAMKNNQPLIVGLDSRSENHAFVLTGVEFRKDERQKGKITPSRVLLMDPASTRSTITSMTWGAFFRRVGMVMNLSVNPAVR